MDFYGTIDGVKVYFACSSLNLKDSISSYLSVVKYIKKLQHRIPNDWLSRVKREYKKGIVDKEEDRVKLQEEGIRAVENCDVLIAEVSYPSGSVGFQIALALSLKKQVLCLYSTEFGEKSPPQIIKARDSANIHIFSYDKKNLLEILEQFFKKYKGRKYIKFNFIISSEIEDYLNWISRNGELSKSRILRKKVIEDIVKKDKKYHEFLIKAP